MTTVYVLFGIVIALQLFILSKVSLTQRLINAQADGVGQAIGKGLDHIDSQLGMNLEGYQAYGDNAFGERPWP